MRLNEYSNLGQDMVTITIDGTTFVIHEDLITYHSPYFATEFARRVQVGHNRSMTLTDTSEDAFALFNCWIYRGTLANAADQGDDSADNLLGLALFATRVLTPGLQNDAIKQAMNVVDQSNFIFSRSAMSSAYQKTTAGNPIRKLITDLVALALGEEGLKEVCGHIDDGEPVLPRELLVDVVLKLRHEYGGFNTPALNVKNYMVDTARVEEGIKREA